MSVNIVIKSQAILTIKKPAGGIIHPRFFGETGAREPWIRSVNIAVARRVTAATRRNCVAAAYTHDLALRRGVPEWLQGVRVNTPQLRNAWPTEQLAPKVVPTGFPLR
ncbi:uncharacterized protein MCYG_02387 [Microsporum canis CBS 113480]|uniref:Uncharacterized protein n=1 Tax=Arthroderma otae (strain ATCC MYA-4605 / CBS 113480) TaxID=554155 RepID=C5FJE7_ARTOC|nr:uncharacterized protein MCYG_02387 [Microsporum canis CBS 113480]EEQ29568.1 predicted protein [Microsporum canis CBS 113480]